MAPAILTSTAECVQQDEQQKRVPAPIPEPAAASVTLYEKLGGAPAVEAAVNVFYKKVLADPLLAPYFEGMDMEKQLKKQAKFLTYAFGGSRDYSGRSIAITHRHLVMKKGLNLTHFDAVAGHLVATLKELGVSDELVGEAAAVVMPLRPIFDPTTYGMSAATDGADNKQEEQAAPAKEEPAAAATPSLYEKLGGAPAVDAAVDVFYKKVLADPLLAPYFEGMDMEKQLQKQAKFLTYAFGGSRDYSGRSIAITHRHLVMKKGLNLTHFDAVAGHLVATLKELGVSDELVGEAAAVVMPLRPIFDPETYKK